MNYEKGEYVKTNNPYIKTTPRKWTESEIEYLLSLRDKGLTIEEICPLLDRSYVSIQIKLKRLKKKDGTYNSKHNNEKTQINKKFVEFLNPNSILDLYHGNGNKAYKKYKTITNDINSEFDCDYHLDALQCLCKLYYENKKFDMIDLDPFGSSFDCFDLAIKMANKGICITLGEMGHKRFKRLDFVEKRYGINSFNEFTSNNLIKTIQYIGLQNKKRLIVWCKKDWINISRVWFTIEPYKQDFKWNKNNQ